MNAERKWADIHRGDYQYYDNLANWLFLLNILRIGILHIKTF